MINHRYRMRKDFFLDTKMKPLEQMDRRHISKVTFGQVNENTAGMADPFGLVYLKTSVKGENEASWMEPYREKTPTRI